jgi:[NiFe] hydrogenase diaphorase moiety large subunit
MLISQQERLTDSIDYLVREHGSDRGALIPILQSLQQQYHTINDFAMQTVADRLGIHPVEVYAVVTFYAFLNERYQGRFVIRLCRTISCHMAEKDAVARQLRTELGIDFGETTADGRFTLEWAHCLGMCDQGPAMLVNDQVFTQVTPAKVHEILYGCERVFGPHAVCNLGGSNR